MEVQEAVQTLNYAPSRVYYKILGDYEKLTTMEYVLQVTVNPNWDGDVYLPLDKSDDSN